MSRILKPAQTVAGSHMVRLYQPVQEAGAQTGQESGVSEPPDPEQDQGGRRYALISEEKRKILEHARNQAEQAAASILEEAYAQRDNIVNTARDEAGRIREQARQEGYGQGLRQALGDIGQDIDGIRSSVEKIGAEFSGFEQRLGSRIADLSFMMAEKILRKKVECDETELADMIEKAVLSERDKENITLHMPAQAVKLIETLEKRLEPLRDKNSGSGGTIRIKAEERPLGFVQVETEEGIVDASLDVQLDNLKKHLLALESRQ